jgi:hypothetical protein
MRRKYGIVVLAAGGMAIAVYFVDLLLGRAHLRGDETILDNVLLALLVAAVAFLLEQRRENALARQRQRAAIIDQMNHHIRNALQIIVCQTNLEVSRPQELRDIASAVDRIDWALREILPAVGTTESGTVDRKSKGQMSRR